jgi:23S rRNA (cytidine1920-2'-O)/16S rRNA (cytidine1409-2'-O)-methyltransferase
MIACDVSFISLRQVLPAARGLFGHPRSGARPLAPATPAGTIIALFKPQFEAEKSEVPRGGVIRDPHLLATLIGRFAAWCARNGFRVLGLTSSPIPGHSGNREFFFLLRPWSDE